MATSVYILCTLSSLVCALMLTRGYRRTRLPLLFWSAMCFFVLALANVLLVFDLVVYPSGDLTMWRTGITLVALGVLLYGLIFESN